jgi:hypothetical protein
MVYGYIFPLQNISFQKLEEHLKLVAPMVVDVLVERLPPANQLLVFWSCFRPGSISCCIHMGNGTMRSVVEFLVAFHKL